MSNCCDIANPLIRDGVSQRQRQAPALPPGYIRVDERDLADFWVFVYRLARQVKYYDLNNQPTGDWQAFLTGSTPVWIALISRTPWQALNQQYKAQLKTLRDRGAAEGGATILNIWADMLSALRLWFEVLQPYTPLKSMIRGLVRTNLGEAVTRMRAFDLAFASETSDRAIPPHFFSDFATAAGVTRQPDADFYSGFAQTFGLTLGAPIADSALFGDDPDQVQSELDAVFQILFQNYRQVIQLAPQYLIHSLEARQDHLPHIAMFIGFWEVLRPARDDLNRMTQRHLDFFYQTVLRLPKRSAQADHAHLLLELAKFQKVFALKADVRFRAGKDATGVELFYKLDQEVVLDKAQVTSLQSFFLDSTEGAQAGGGIPKTLTGFYASPIADSFDGQGAEFPKDQAVKAWPPFDQRNCEGDRPCNPASIGIAIADPILLLGEGKRTVTLRLTFKPQGEDSQFRKAIQDFQENGGQVKQLFDIHFSGEAAWLPATLQSGSLLNASQLILKVVLAADQDPVVPFHAELQEPALQLDTTHPVALVTLKTQPRINGKAPYYFLHEAQLETVEVTTEVDAVRNLVLQNDLSVLDPTKPFQPFGPIPKVGGNFYIGSQEVFQKPLTKLTFHVDLEAGVPAEGWNNYYAGYGSDSEPGAMSLQALRSKVWQPATGAPQRSLFQLNGFSPPTSVLNKLALTKPEPTEPIEIWTFQSKNGFLRLQLTGSDFRHDDYAKVLSRQVLAQAMASMPAPRAVVGAYYRVEDKLTASTSIYFNNAPGNPAAPKPSPNIPVGSEVVVPNEPFTPVIQSLYLSYTAKTTLNLAQADQPDQPWQLFHRHPFDRFERLTAASTPYLLPHFDQEGELLIGLTDLQPLTVLNLLFQVAEETADTSLKTAEVQWHYLVDNTWKPFEAYQVVSDRTQKLIGSGIVQLAIPADISNQHTTILDPTLHWLKVSVPERSGAIPDIIDLHAQAARVTFVDEGNDPNHLSQPLPPGTITKLVEPQPEVKAIAQPYPSFDGRPRETSQNYYIRISEHLRHKGRAITIFDYERIVLEQFPEIYKVRCINHGQVVDDHLRELVPGAITLAVIPDLSQRQTTNDLQPKVNINLLQKIQTTLQKYASPWVDLQVVNPRYEAIQVEFEVRFKEPFEGNFEYYSRELENAIVGFLSPWTVSDGADIHFGGKVYRSSILNFVEEQPTVDYVLNFKMHQGSQRDIREFVAPSARSILVSVPPSTATSPGPYRHQIERASACPDSRPLETEKLGYTPLDQIILSDP